MTNALYSTWSRERKTFFNWKKRHKYDKILVYLSQLGRCCYCDKLITPKKMTWEHKTPLCFGGKNNLDNLKLSCSDCNRDKNIETIETLHSPFYLLKKYEDKG